MLKSFRLLAAAVLSTALLFSACTKETVDPDNIEAGKSYYPLVVGKYIMYKNDSTIYDDFNKVTIHRSNYLLYTVEDTFRDAQDRLTYYITVKKRKNSDEQWQNLEVIHVTPTSYGLDLSQRNLRYTKMAWPIENGFSWKGNSQIPAGDEDLQYFQDWDYKYQDMGSSRTVNNMIFNNTVTVLERDEQINDPATQPEDYAEKTYSKSVYAWGVGLIDRVFERWVYQVDPNAPQDAYRKGVKVEMSIVEHDL